MTGIQVEYSMHARVPYVATVKEANPIKALLYAHRLFLI